LIFPRFPFFFSSRLFSLSIALFPPKMPCPRRPLFYDDAKAMTVRTGQCLSVSRGKLLLFDAFVNAPKNFFLPPPNTPPLYPTRTCFSPLSGLKMVTWLSFHYAARFFFHHRELRVSEVTPFPITPTMFGALFPFFLSVKIFFSFSL